MADDKTMPVGARFPKGVSGNPGGRQRGLERRVRDLLGDDIDAILRAQKEIALGVLPAGVAGPIKASDMTKAAEFLSDRGWGKARQIVDIGSEVNLDTLDLTKMSSEDLDDLIAKAEAEVAAAEEEEAGDHARASNASPPES